MTARGGQEKELCDVNARRSRAERNGRVLRNFALEGNFAPWEREKERSNRKRNRKPVLTGLAKGSIRFALRWRGTVEEPESGPGIGEEEPRWQPATKGKVKRNLFTTLGVVLGL